MKIITYNVNGIRAAMKKGFLAWLAEESPDIICLQEVKAQEDQIDLDPIRELGYQVNWHAAVKKGYSGVATLSKTAPSNVVVGCDNSLYDNEGRVLRTDFDQFSLLNVYMPSGSSGELRQSFKMDWLTYFNNYIDKLRREIPNLIICGDVNICHTEIDIHNPKANARSSGFLPEEREWVSCFLNTGFVDAFRHLNKDPHQYTWWSYRANARNKNLGWRIDYFLVTQNLVAGLKSAHILPHVMHSDHCPVSIEFNSQL